MLPQKQPLELMQTSWAQEINPLLAQPRAQSVTLKNVKLTTGTNVINHLLGRKLQGWNPTRVRAAATIYDNQDSNGTPQLTLILVTSADVTIDLEVF